MKNVEVKTDGNTVTLIERVRRYDGCGAAEMILDAIFSHAAGAVN